MNGDNRVAAFADETYQIRFFSGQECREAESLWREVFCEDSQKFTDYYFSEKVWKNRGFILEGSDGIRSMLYLTPESMMAAGRQIESAYIVGVATKKKWRHKGYMRKLLAESFSLLYRENLPFVFLMPAAEEIYLPFGFTRIYDKPVWNAAKLRADCLISMQEADADRMADFAADFLKKEKAVYVLRDSAYYKQQIKELAAQEGCVYGYENSDGDLQGLWMYTNEDSVPEFTEVLAKKELLSEVGTPVCGSKPAIMGRIICVEAILKLLQSDEPMEFVLQVNDPLIEGNNGIFSCHLSAVQTVVERVGEIGSAPFLSMNITELTAVLFGYREISGSIWQKMRLLTPVWINEIV